MVLSWMLYAMALSALFGIAALTVESLARQRSWAGRWTWVAALCGSLLVPAGALLMPDEPPPSGVERLEGVVLRDGTSGAVTIALLATFTELRATVSATPALDEWLLLGWATASASLLLWMAVSSLALARRGRSWLSKRVDGREVWVSADTGPAVVGFLSGRIVLPKWLLETGPVERRLVLRHEEEHIFAGDGKLLGFGLLLLLALPWNLPLWWQFRRLRHAVEVDCDRRVLRSGADTAAYCRTLLEVSAYGMARPVMLAAVPESPSMLERRILAMITPSKRRSAALRATSALVALAALVVAFKTAPPSPAAAETPPPDRSSPAALLPVYEAIPLERYIEAPEEAVTPQVEMLVDSPFVLQAASSSPAFELAALDSPPSLTNPGDASAAIRRLYPRILLDAGISGRVVAQLVVGADGRVERESIKIVEGDHPRFNESTVGVLMAMQFAPGKFKGASVRSLIQMPIRWNRETVTPGP